jgi:hypothetical protein
MVGRRIPSGARVRHGTAPLPPLVGINGCPTRPPVRARNAVVERWSRYRCGRGRGRWTLRESAAPQARRARQRLAPTWGGWWISGYSRSADLRCVSCETCRPRGIAAPRRGGRGSASPLHGVGGGSAVDPRPATVGPYPPSCRGQAVPDPPARQGRHRRRGRTPTLLCEMAVRMVATQVAAPVTRLATQRVAPMRWAGFPGRTRVRDGAAVRPQPGGVRRCLTPRPAAAGKPDRGRSGYRGRVIHTGTFAGVHVATLPGAAPVDRSRVFLAPRAHQPVPTASPCRLLTASPLGEPRRLSG